MAWQFVNMAKHGAGRHVENAGNTADALRTYGSAANILHLLRQTVLPQWSASTADYEQIAGVADNRAASASDIDKVRGKEARAAGSVWFFALFFPAYTTMHS